MKPYKTLSRLGQLRRLRKLAEAALAIYDLQGSRLTFLHYQGNVIFQVDRLGNKMDEDGAGVYLPGRYLLRILTISDLDMIRSELVWLAALTREAGLPVPEPFPTPEGELLTTISIPGIPGERVVSFMRWVDGRQLTKSIRPKHAQGIGELMGKLHRFAAGWQPSQDFNRFVWDWDGLLGDAGHHWPISELVASMPAAYRQPFRDVSQQVREVMAALGKGSDAYGMIHADMYMENVLFKAGQPRPIDFEDCGFGYWLFDIGVVLSQWWGTGQWEELRDAFLDGYAQIRHLEESQLAHLELFIVAVYAVSVLWSTAFIKHNPALREQYEKWREGDGNKLLQYYSAH